MSLLDLQIIVWFSFIAFFFSSYFTHCKLLLLDIVYFKLLSQFFLCLITFEVAPLTVDEVLWEISLFSVFCIGKFSSVFAQPCQGLKTQRA